jgi:hypothetical protein
MTYRELIIKYLNRHYTDDHPYVYLYSMGQKRSQTTAMAKLGPKLLKVFSGNERKLHTIIIEYMEFKKEQYKNGEITIKPLH